MMRFVFTGLLFVLLPALLPMVAYAEDSLADGRTGAVSFQSFNPVNYAAFLDHKGAEATVTGTLTLPADSSGKVPAVVTSHGSGGVSELRDHNWARHFNAAGYASFVVDSFTPRGIRETAADQSQLSTWANVADALAALKLLATHPRIDRDRIAIIGFSKGGQVVLYTALDTARHAVVHDGLRFAAHIALYPYCNDRVVSERVTGAPLLFLLGGRDDYTPAEPCQRYAEWFKGKGAVVTVKVYPDAYHDFDFGGAIAYVARVVTGRKCDAEVDLDRRTIRRLDTGEDITANARPYFAACTSRGAMLGRDPEASADAPVAAAAFLRQAFGR